MQDGFPNLEILPPSQLKLWGELGAIPDQFTLYGGTAIALQLGHRISIDFDFFTFENFDPLALIAQLPFLSNADVLQMEANTLTCAVDRDGLVQVSFFGLPKLKNINTALLCHSPKIKVADLTDLAGMKAMVVQKRAQLKDYLDIAALLQAGYSLSDALSAAKYIYGNIFNPQITLKALSYFEDGDVWKIDQAKKEIIIRAVKETNLDKLSEIRAT